MLPRSSNRVPAKCDIACQGQKGGKLAACNQGAALFTKMAAGVDVPGQGAHLAGKQARFWCIHQCCHAPPRACLQWSLCLLRDWHRSTCSDHSWKPTAGFADLAMACHNHCWLYQRGRLSSSGDNMMLSTSRACSKHVDTLRICLSATAPQSTVLGPSQILGILADLQWSQHWVQSAHAQHVSSASLWSSDMLSCNGYQDGADASRIGS